MRNKRVPRNNKSGVKGVCWVKTCNKWAVYFKWQGTQKYLGIYTDLSDAINVRKQAERTYLGEIDAT